ncbi:cyclic nucleotide-binding domain protein [Anaerococcus lactolyticus ATCC 51172]|uniref:Cyclic nucleotide-binding domain protein n=1 Tax=Anaerococcus lactolyticus ATCC 51172 TaxID=525254 RepID=C2BHE5_9FIRM|nr:Crp/Fnr family transcriptional regulator [Anaerococcus lactolyticus]EEI85558.1 cyclic nucleotide-binding domain protein [Anaerococcus lactolyticus ATCC 51172]
MDLREIKIFKNLTDQDLDLIRSKTEFIEKTYGKGEYIFMAGDKSGDLFYLMEGVLNVYQIDSNGKRFIFQNFTKPTLFGEVYSYLGEPFDFDCECASSCKILIIKDFKKIFEPPCPESFLRSYINFLSYKCLALSKKNQITSQASLRQKIGKYLLETENQGKVKLSMKREDLADYLSTTRPSLSRELSKMAEEGIIKVGGDFIEILDRNGIEF